MSSSLQSLLLNAQTIKALNGWGKASKNIKDPLSLCFSERFLIIEEPKTKSKKDFWLNIKRDHILKLSIILKEVGFHGKTYQNRATIINESTSEEYIDYPINILRYIKNIKYRQLDI